MLDNLFRSHCCPLGGFWNTAVSVRQDLSLLEPKPYFENNSAYEKGESDMDDIYVPVTPLRTLDINVPQTSSAGKRAYISNFNTGRKATEVKVTPKKKKTEDQETGLVAHPNLGYEYTVLQAKYDELLLKYTTLKARCSAFEEELKAKTDNTLYSGCDQERDFNISKKHKQTSLQKIDSCESTNDKGCMPFTFNIPLDIMLRPILFTICPEENNETSNSTDNTTCTSHAVLLLTEQLLLRNKNRLYCRGLIIVKTLLTNKRYRSHSVSLSTCLDPLHSLSAQQKTVSKAVTFDWAANTTRVYSRLYHTDK